MEKERGRHFRKHNLVKIRYAFLGDAKRRERPLAYCKVEGSKRPGIIYIPGYFSRMYIAKANILEEFCLRTGHPFVKYDPEGVGESRVDDSGEVSLDAWFEDACYVIERLTTGPVMLVSSSNGGWMATLMAVRYPARVHSVVMLAPAVNHGLDDDLYEQLLHALDPAAAARVAAGEPVRFTTNWGVEVTTSRRFLDQMRRYRVDLERPVPVRCPVRIVHSQADASVHWENSLQLMAAVPHDDVRLYLKKRGNHRLVAGEDLALQMAAVRELIEHYPVPDAPSEPATERGEGPREGSGAEADSRREGKRAEVQSRRGGSGADAQSRPEGNVKKMEINESPLKQRLVVGVKGEAQMTVKSKL